MWEQRRRPADNSFRAKLEPGDHHAKDPCFQPPRIRNLRVLSRPTMKPRSSLSTLNAPICNHQSLSHTHKATLWNHSFPLIHRTWPLPQPRLPAQGLGASSPRLVPGTWQVHVDQQGLGGAALSHRCRGLGGGRWGGPVRGGTSALRLGCRSPPEATVGDRKE